MRACGAIDRQDAQSDVGVADARREMRRAAWRKRDLDLRRTSPASPAPDCCSRNSIRRSRRSRRATPPRWRASRRPAARGSMLRERGGRGNPSSRRASANSSSRSTEARNALLVGKPERHRIVERRARAARAPVARRAVRDHLGDHRVVVRRNLRAGFERMIGAHALGGRHNAMRPACGRKSRAGSSAHSRASIAWPRKRMSACCRVKRLAPRDAKLPFDQVDPGDRLGHRMLDLQPRVHLHEVEVARRHRAGTRSCRRRRISTAFASATAAAPSFSRNAASTAGEGAFLDQLLVPPLHRAVALAEMHHIAVLVGEDLHLDVARAGRARVPAAAGRRRRRARASERAPSSAAASSLSLAHQPHAAPAAARGRLDHQRKAERLRGSHQARIALIVRLGARNGRDAGLRARCASPRPCRPSAG